MKESVVMHDLRKIRDENSLRYLSQTPEERSNELKKSIELFIEMLGKPVKIVNSDNQRL